MHGRNRRITDSKSQQVLGPAHWRAEQRQAEEGRAGSRKALIWGTGRALAALWPGIKSIPSLSAAFPCPPAVTNNHLWTNGSYITFHLLDGPGICILCGMRKQTPTVPHWSQRQSYQISRVVPGQEESKEEVGTWNPGVTALKPAAEIDIGPTRLIYSTSFYGNKLAIFISNY